MKRVMFLSPKGLMHGGLTASDKSAISQIFDTMVINVPETDVFGGKVLIDSIVPDEFSEKELKDAGFNFTIIGIWQWDGINDIKELMPFDSGKLFERLKPKNNYDGDGEVISTTPAILHEPHKFAGWPNLI